MVKPPSHQPNNCKRTTEPVGMRKFVSILGDFGSVVGVGDTPTLERAARQNSNPLFRDWCSIPRVVNIRGLFCGKKNYSSLSFFFPLFSNPTWIE